MRSTRTTMVFSILSLTTMPVRTLRFTFSSSIAGYLLAPAFDAHFLFGEYRKYTGNCLFDLFNTACIVQLSDRVLETEVEQFFLVLFMFVFKLRYAEIS
jgi:hypothetical protein